MWILLFDFHICNVLVISCAYLFILNTYLNFVLLNIVAILLVNMVIFYSYSYIFFHGFIYAIEHPLERNCWYCVREVVSWSLTYWGGNRCQYISGFRGWLLALLCSKFYS